VIARRKALSGLEGLVEIVSLEMTTEVSGLVDIHTMCFNIHHSCQSAPYYSILYSFCGCALRVVG